MILNPGPMDTVKLNNVEDFVILLHVLGSASFSLFVFVVVCIAFYEYLYVYYAYVYEHVC